MQSTIIRFFLLIGIMSMASCQNNSSEKELIKFSDKPVVFTGMIKGHQGFVNYLFVKAEVENLIKGGTEITNAPISPDGSFELKMPIHQSQDFEFSYGGKEIRIFANPGDSIQLSLKSSDFLANKINSDNHKLESKANQLNLALLEFQNAHLNNFKSISKNVFDPEAYKLQRLKKWKTEKIFAHKFIDETQADESIKNWITNHIDYTAASDLLNYINEFNLPTAERKLPKTYLSFLKDIPLENPTALRNASYINFLNLYTKHQIEFTEKTMDLCDENFGNEFKNENRTPISEIIYSKFIKGLKDVNNQDCVDGLVAKIKSESWKTFVNSKQYKNVATPTINFITDNKQTDLLSSIIDSHKGKIIYIDFWATWCGPCIKEMAIYDELRAQFSPDEMAFVYLAINSPEEDWQWTSKNLNLIGDNYLLTEAQYESLDRLIYIEGIPHHLIINQAGDLIGEKAPPPSLGEGIKINPELLQTIHQLSLPNSEMILTSK